MTSLTTRARRAVTSLALLAAGLVGGGLTLGLAPTAVITAAGAATCTSAGGVSVVVDFRELGGSTIAACAADGGGKSATAIFASVGVELTEAQRAPGFVCRVNGVPLSDPCQNASPVDAYWGLWWADGSNASWTYSSSGVGGLIVPAGGSVGWSWKQGTGSAAPPGIAPPVVASTPTPSATPSSTSSPSSPTTPTPTGGTSGGDGGKGGKGGKGGNGGKDGSSPTQSPSPSATPSASPSGSASATPSATPEPTVAPESPGDSRDKGASGDPSEDPTAAPESPGDSTPSADPEATETAPESAGDSTPSATPDAGSPAADAPARVPAAVTWGVVGLLAIGIAGSAAVARRRRGV